MLRIYQGAEAIIYQDGEKIIKDRVRKGYRIDKLDERIRKLRTRNEGKLLDKARRSGVDTPRVFETSNYKLEMEYIPGEKLKKILDSLNEKERKRIYEIIGESVAKLHTNGIIHGDLTTSNMILHENKLFFIDFGLGKNSDKTEDQAADLFLLHEAIKSTHLNLLDEAWNALINSYKDKYTRSKEVLSKIDKISKRRRYLGE